MLREVPIARVMLGTRLRTINEEQVEAIMASIAEVGLLNPITVYEREILEAGIAVPGYGVVAGGHRLEACRRLGLVDIPAHVVDLPDLRRQLAECDENLCGTKLSPAERAMFTRRRKDIYLALYPETRQHVAGGKARQGAATDNLSVAADTAARDNLSFAADTAAKTGVDERTVRRDAARGERLGDEVLEQVRGTDLDKGVVLDRLARSSDPAAELERMRAQPRPVPPPPPVRNDAEAEDAWLSAILRLWNKAPRQWRERFLEEVRA